MLNEYDPSTVSVTQLPNPAPMTISAKTSDYRSSQITSVTRMLSCGLFAGLLGVIWLFVLTETSLGQDAEKAREAIRARPVLREPVRLRGVDPFGEVVQDEEDEEATEESDGDDKIPSGPITEVAENMRALISFEWKNGILEPTLLEGRQEVQQTIYAIRSSSGGGGMSSSSSGDNSWWYQFQGQRMTGTFQNNWPRNAAGGQLMFNLVELEEPYRELTIQHNDSDQLSILLKGGALPFILRVKQNANGEFVVQEVNGVDVFSHREKSFGEFCRKHVDYSQDHLLPLLKAVGIEPPPTPQDREVQDKVIERLKPLDEQKLQEFKDLIAGLDSTSFEEREAATKTVAERFDDYRDVVERSIDDDEAFSAEARTRLLSLLKEKSESDEIRTRDVVSRLQLTEDPKYLIWLLEQREADDDRELLVETLVAITDQSIGDDIGAWKAWAGDSNDQELPVNNVEVDAEAIFSAGQLTKMREQTAKLVKLTTIDGSLQIDRDHWAEPFGGKTLNDLSNEIKEEIRKRGLPESYFNGIDSTRYPMLGYPHVLFESFHQELLKNPDKNNSYSRRTSGSNFTPNRIVSANGLDCSIATQPGANGRVIGRANNESKQFRLRFSEQNSPRRSISIEENEELQLRVEVTCESSDTIVRLIEMPDDKGWVVQDLRGTKVFADQADTYEALYDANKSYFDETFFPLLEKLGFQPPSSGDESGEEPGDDSTGDDSTGDDSTGDDSTGSDAAQGDGAQRDGVQTDGS